MEANAVPVTWLARVRCAAFWFTILSNPLCKGRILRVAAGIKPRAPLRTKTNGNKYAQCGSKKLGSTLWGREWVRGTGSHKRWPQTTSSKLSLQACQPHNSYIIPTLLAPCHYHPYSPPPSPSSTSRFSCSAILMATKITVILE